MSGRRSPVGGCRSPEPAVGGAHFGTYLAPGNDEGLRYDAPISCASQVRSRRPSVRTLGAVLVKDRNRSVMP